MSVQMNPWMISKIVLWVLIAIVSTSFLRKNKVTSKVRNYFLVGGVIIFGFIYGVEPNPVSSLRNLLKNVFLQQRLLPAILLVFVILLLVSWWSNKSICGWGCQFGLLQDLLYRIPSRKRKPPIRLSQIIRLFFFVGLILGLVVWKIDWLAFIDPFGIFRWSFSQPVILGMSFVSAVLILSVFIYRPWCHFFCPFGFISWIVEQKSLNKPVINLETCKQCQLCVKACPGNAMEDILHNKRWRSDCFACGACIEACRFDSIHWGRKSLSSRS